MAQSITVQGNTLLVPESADPCPLWISYYDRLKSEVGKDHAKALWLITWKSNASIRCLTDPNFSNWLKRNDLNVSNLATRTLADLSEISGNFLGLSKQMTKVLAIGVPAVLVSLIIGIIWMIRNSADKVDVEDLAMLSPVGRGLKLLK